MELDSYNFQRDKLGEVSRIFVDAKYRDIQITKAIINEVKNSCI
ncbi:hypothetical protein M947_01180 [Sulfurimonas hongkongensis]|uniref:Uncharacterized protein n=1 Tax=Sulfurimonas hongkongensis TaxID=1172190 RepID=T0KTV3_9BACT|nr:hypothetical protein M947_01180 [Sulfurimonas hongkongensis]